MKRLTLIMMAALALAIALDACDGSAHDTTSPGSTAAPSTTQRETAPGARRAGTPTTAALAPPTTTRRPVRPAATVRVSLYARAGEVPPGRVDPLDAPAWKATGAGWDGGHVDVFVKRAGGEGAVLDVGARADASGAWMQTFVLPTDAPPGSYVVVASQGALRAEASLVLQG
jgi:hypothetical protein